MKENISKVIKGGRSAVGVRMGIVCSRFNETLVVKLLAGAVDCVRQQGGDSENITVVWTPGAYEIPLIAKKLAASGNYDVILALGVVIRGATEHAHYINSEVAAGLARAGWETGIPVIYGVLTTETVEQAMERTVSGRGNRGYSTAAAAIEMANLTKSLG